MVRPLFRRTYNIMARRRSKKNAKQQPTVPRNVRKACDSSEVYAILVKLLGGQHCEVQFRDGTTMLCVIRRAFRGRNKRSNRLSPGSWLLVGLRDWETRLDGKERCDLLEVYSDTEKAVLVADGVSLVAEGVEASSAVDVVFGDSPEAEGDGSGADGDGEEVAFEGI